VPARAGLGALPALEVEGLHLLDQLHAEAEARRRQLVEVAGVLGLLVGQHAALARADAGAGPLGAAGQRHLGLLGERAEAHVRHEERRLEPQRLLRVGPDHELRPHLLVVEQRQVL